MTEVVVEHDGEREHFTADIFVAACGAANTAKLLLSSASDKHPNGLANGSDQVGRNYMFHNSQAVLALSREENPTIFQKTLGLNDFYLANDEFDYPLGNIQMVGKSQAEMYRGEKPGETKLAPEWTLERVAKHAIDFWLSTEDLPRPENRVTVDKDGKVTLSYKATNEVPKQKLYEKLKSILGKLDLNEGHLLKRFAYMKNEIPVAGVAHQAGTCRFGSDPASSVVDVELPGARARQPLRRRHEHLPEHRRGQPGADGDGELAARRRPPARAAEVAVAQFSRPSMPLSTRATPITVARDHRRVGAVPGEPPFEPLDRGGRPLRRDDVGEQRQLEQQEHHDCDRDDSQHDRHVAEVQLGDRWSGRRDRTPPGKLSRMPTTKVSRAEPLFRVCCQRRRLLRLVGMLAPAALLAARHAARPDDEGDQQRERTEDDVDPRADRVLGRAELARVAQPEHDREPDRDARRVRAEEIAEQKPLRPRHEQHHRRGREQHRVERREQRQAEDPAQADACR